MATHFGFVISLGDHTIREYDHDTGAVIRTLCSYNSDWSPYYVTNFDPLTGMPEAFAIGAEQVSNPCSLCSDASTTYILDPYTCRVLRYEMHTGTLHASFGGKRGIGSGRISPDSTLRSVIALANGSVWVTDNDDGAGGSGTGYLARFTPLGVWVSDWSIAGWIAALNPTAVFDQITGWAWDPVREVYWALAQGSTACTLFAVDASGTATGEVIDLTARLASTLGLTVPGHGDTPAGRLITRGLKYFNSYLYLWSGSTAIRVDLTHTGGDQLILTGTSALSPGSLNELGTELTQVLTNEAQGVQMVKVVTLSTLSTRSYGVHDTFPEDGVSDLAEPWDVSVAPFAEDTNARAVRTISARARIRATLTVTCQAKAAIRNTVTQTVMARARILQGVMRQCTARAAIDEANTLPDSIVDSWSVSQEISQASRQFNLRVNEAYYQTGQEVRIKAGYDQSRLTLILGRVDEVGEDTTPQEQRWQVVGRDIGTRKLQTRITKTWSSTPPRTMPRAHDIVRELMERIGLTVGVLEFPDYDLYNSFQSLGDPIIEIVGTLLEPWNIFGRIRYYPVIRDDEFSVIRVDWANLPDTGYPVLLQHRARHGRAHVDYLDDPRLNEVEFFFIRGAAWTEPRSDLGVQTRIEYFRNVVNNPTIESVFGVLGETITTETTVIETFYGDKVLTRSEQVTEGLDPISRTEESFFYVEPGEDISGLIIPGGPAAITYWSGQPSENALLWTASTKRWGNISESQGATAGNEGSPTTFREVFRQQTTYYYDQESQVAAEASAIQEFDEDLGAWGITRYTHRTHSQTTGGTLRTQLTNFVFEDSKFTLDSIDVQQVGGVRPGIANPSSRKNLVTHQAQAPQGEIDADGNAIDPGEGLYVWSFENPYIGQDVCDTLYQMTLEERAFQLLGFRWETVSFDSVLNPNIYVGQLVRGEITTGIYRSFRVVQVSHSFNHQQAMTQGIARRLTQEDL